MEFKDLWQRYFDVFVRKAQRFGLDHASAEDIVQDVAIEAINKMSVFTDEEHFKRWAFKVIRHRTVDYFSKNLPFNLGEHGNEVISTERPNSAQQSEFLESVRQIIFQLPARQLEVLERLNAGQSTVDIAQEMGVSQSTIRSLKRHALSFIKSKVQEVEEEKQS